MSEDTRNDAMEMNNSNTADETTARSDDEDIDFNSLTDWRSKII